MDRHPHRSFLHTSLGLFRIESRCRESPIGVERSEFCKRLEKQTGDGSAILDFAPANLNSFCHFISPQFCAALSTRPRRFRPDPNKQTIILRPTRKQTSWLDPESNIHHFTCEEEPWLPILFVE